MTMHPNHMCVLLAGSGVAAEDPQPTLIELRLSTHSSVPSWEMLRLGIGDII